MPMLGIENINELKIAGVKLVKMFGNVMPVLIGILLLVTLFMELVPSEFYVGIFTGNVFIDSFVGAVFGSIAAGSPVNSYIIGGELMKHGISMFAVTAFMVAWITVGIIQFPAESLMLGKKFAAVRNLTSFFLCIIVAVVTVFTLGLF